MNYTTQCLTDPRKNRQSGSKVHNIFKEKIHTVEYQELCIREYQGKYYLVNYTILESAKGELLRCESDWILHD